MLSGLSLPAVFLVFAAAAAAIVVAGVRVTGLVDRLADKTGLGEALVGGVLLGAMTSLSGTVVSVTAALDGRASLAFANGVGGIAVQTAFLALADLLHRRANLEHASADVANIFQSGVLILLLSLPMLAFVTPPVTVLAVHPVSLVLVVVYILGVRATAQVREQPMWRPVATPETRRDTPEEPEDTRAGIAGLLAWLLGLALVLGFAGYVMAKAGGRVSDQLGISGTTVGALMTAVATSTPELVTTMAAVRRGALQLAVGGIIGGNSFDVLFLSLSDVFYRDGSLYHAISAGDLFWLILGLTTAAVLMLGLIVRERSGPANIGFESIGVLGLYGAGVALQVMLG